MSNYDALVQAILEATKKSKKKLDFSKDDVNDDGKVDKTDGYLKKRNAAIAASIAKKKPEKK
jgi:hypothetical protein